MAKKFDIPEFYRSPLIKRIKDAQQAADPKRKQLKPARITHNGITVLIPRYFGFCFGVQNAIEIAYDALDKNPDKRVFLLSEMIHNPNVNADLEQRGAHFLFHTDGSPIIPLDELRSDDVVIVPAFGTTLEMQAELEKRGVNPYAYDTTCPFVTRVWKRGSQLGDQGHTLVIHGKYQHEETRATFSHAAKHGPAVVVLNLKEAQLLADCMLGKQPKTVFDAHFGMKSTPGFDPQRDLQKFGVINQTTMLATETAEVMELLKKAAVALFGEETLPEHMADTKDTLCYATYENQSATTALLQEDIDLAVVIGGFNSSNTLHLVELLEQKCLTFHIRDTRDFLPGNRIHHFDQWQKTEKTTENWLPAQRPLRIAVNAGASCPDALVDAVLAEVFALAGVQTDLHALAVEV
jgi:4-hydroxy-3-methylbut-2-enyl diphosphate reductase